MKEIWEGGHPLSSQEGSPSYTEWIGYHGTSLSAALEIVDSNYRISVQENDWLGNGAYFFIEGLADPCAKADEWARFRSWDSRRRSRKYDQYAVLESKIRTQMHLDLDDVEDLKSFNKIRDKLIERMKKEGFSNRDSYALKNDCYVSNFLFQELSVDALVRREAIMSSPAQLKVRIPNCRIMCLKEPERCVIEHTIVTRGAV